MALVWANTWHFGTPLVSPPLKWRLRNDCRNSILMTDLGSASDWLRKISLAVRPIRITTQIWVVTHFCSRFSDVIWRGETSDGVVKCLLFSQADMAQRSSFCFSSDSCRIKVLLQWGTKVLTHFRKMAPFCIVDILIPFPCLPQPLPPKINVELWSLKSLFYFRQHWFGGWGDLRRLKGKK